MRNILIAGLLLMLSLTVSCKVPGGGKDKPSWQGRYIDNSDITGYDAKVPGRMPDATKTNNTSEMCWAYAVCNVLEYTGHIVDNRVCINNMRDEYGNESGYALNAYNYYMREFLALDPRDYYDPEYDTDLAPDFIANTIDAGLPAVFNLSKIGDGNGHVVAVYAYAETDDGYIFYVVDGDDHKYTAIIQVIWTADGWRIENSGTYNKYEPSRAFSIAPNSII